MEIKMKSLKVKLNFNIEFKDKQNVIEKREQKVIIIGKSDMIKYLNSELVIQYG